ncbi:MAG: PA2779 family protein [Porticoccaceae bacterium]
MKYSRYSLAITLVTALLVVTSVVPASAAMIGTGQAAASTMRVEQLDRIDKLMTQESVRQQFQHLGVSPAQAQARVQALTDVELSQLADQLDEMPAGGSVLGLVGAVFVVLLILEIVGVIDIFRKV